jgi:hypothetical protein
MEFRCRKQCRRRYLYHLDSNIIKTPFSVEEDKLLIMLQNHWGNQWIRIATCMKGRSNDAVSNRWHLLNRKSFVTPQKVSNCEKCYELPQQYNSPTCIDAVIDMDIPKVENILQSQKPFKFTHIRESCNFDRQNEHIDTVWPFVAPTADWSPVKLRIPGVMPTHNFSSCGKRTTIWPQETERILSIASINFHLLLTILCEEFGWKVKYGQGLDHTYDIFSSPKLTDNATGAQSPTFVGNSLDLRVFVEQFGFTGQNVVHMNTSICYVLFVDVNDDMNTHTNLILSEEPSRLPLSSFVSSGFGFRPSKCTKEDCKQGYVCDCVVWWLSRKEEMAAMELLVV